MSRDLDIRVLADGEIDRVCDITVAAWEPAYERYRANLGAELFRARYGDDWRTYKANQVRDQCERSPEHVRVAEVDGEIAGFVTFSIDNEKGIGKIGNNAVAPTYQGQGIATELYEHVLANFRDQGLHFATVATGLEAEYAPARRAYETVGFDIQRRTVRYWQEL